MSWLITIIISCLVFPYNIMNIYNMVKADMVIGDYMPIFLSQCILASIFGGVIFSILYVSFWDRVEKWLKEIRSPKII